MLRRCYCQQRHERSISLQTVASRLALRCAWRFCTEMVLGLDWWGKKRCSSTSSRSRRLHISAVTQSWIWRLLRSAMCLPYSQAVTELWLRPGVLIKLQMNLFLWCQWCPQHPEEIWSGLDAHSGQSVKYIDHLVLPCHQIRYHTVTHTLC